MGFESLLSVGAISQILDDEKPVDPVLQIIGYKPIGSDQMAFGQTTEELRYRLMMGDGKRAHQYCIITNQDIVNDIRSGKIEKWSIIRVKNYQTVDYGDGPPENKRRLIYILNLEMVKNGSEVNRKITVDGPIENRPPPPQPSVEQRHEPQPVFQQPQVNNNSGYSEPTQPKPYNYGGDGGAMGRNVIESPRRIHASFEQQTIGIGELTPYIGKWNIKGRVTSKSGIREYSNAKGAGKLFSFSIADKTGEVKVTAFNADCDRVFPVIEPNKVYLMSRGSVKHADKRYTSADFEITLNSDSLVEEIVSPLDVEDIPLAKFNFVGIGALASVQPNQPVDLMGVITEVSDVSSVMSRTKNKELKKRNITIVDMTRHTISVTIWGDPADTFNGAVGDVFVTKSARIGTYGGRSASAGDTIFVNPDIPEVRKAKNWYNNLLDANFTALTNSQESGASSDQYKNLAELKNMSMLRNMTSSGATSGQYAKCKAFLLSVGKNPVYKCCPVDGCGKKLVDMQNGEMKCDKCAQTYSNYRYRYKVDVEISDNMDTTWVTLWDEKAENILKRKPEDLERLMKMENKDEYERIITSCNFQMYNFTLRSRIDTYNQEERVKMNVINMAPLDPVTYCKELQTEIRAIAARPAVAAQ